MIKTFNYEDDIKLSKNLSSREFRCKCGTPHTYRVDTDLVVKLQSLVDIFNADKIIINSGYRCPNHDRNVGGNGNGRHTKGEAADFILYRGSSPINTKQVACKMQDIGFNGIGNIDKSYTAIHGDVRVGYKWYGDEAVPGGTNSNVTSDFYAYYKIDKSSNLIKKLQTALNKNYNANLVIDGIVGPNTLKAAKKCFVFDGDKGDIVALVQEGIKILGYDCGSIDGIAGDKTMKAIHNWQKDNNLGVGYFGGSDWNKFLL